MRLTSSWFVAILVGLSLCVTGCSSTHKKKATAKKAKRPTTLVITQTGSNLRRTVTLSDDEDPEMKAKAKHKKKEPVDEDYVPRGGFR